MGWFILFQSGAAAGEGQGFASLPVLRGARSCQSDAGGISMAVQRVWCRHGYKWWQMSTQGV